jgi:hypothetical protein
VRVGKLEVKRRVWVGLGCGLAVTVAWWAWTRSQPPRLNTVAPTAQPFVRLAGAGDTTTDQILRERAALLDPTPLFFPTEWNYGQRPLPGSLTQQPGHVFESFGPKTMFTEELQSYGKEAQPPPEKLADVLTQGNEAPFAGLGHVDVVLPTLPERDSYLEVRSFSGDKPLISQSLKINSLPRYDFAPLEFIVAVSPAGIIGEPVLASGSGWDEVDAFIRAYLVKTLKLGWRLSPGHYRVLVGP